METARRREGAHVPHEVEAPEHTARVAETSRCSYRTQACGYEYRNPGAARAHRPSVEFVRMARLARQETRCSGFHLGDIADSSMGKGNPFRKAAC